MLDDRAVNILFKTYWSAGGWKDVYSTPAKDFEYAKRAGVMFDPVTYTHAEVVKRVLEAVKKTTLRAVADAFVASLRNGRMDERSALGSYAIMSRLTPHKVKGRRGVCDHCGYGAIKGEKEDLNVLNFERLKWGGVRHRDIVYAAFDLEQFAIAEHLRPNDDAIETLKDILQAIGEVPPRTTGTALPKLLGPHVRGSLSERQNLVAILGYCGVLGTEKNPGYLDRQMRGAEPICYTEMGYPAGLWRGTDGVNQEAVRKVFGYLL